MSFSWQLLVDWNNNGQYNHALSNISDRWLTLSWRLGIREAFESMADEAELVAELDNTDGLFTPTNTGSALYGLLRPGRQVAVRAVLNGTPSLMYVGRIETIRNRWPPGAGAAAGALRAELVATGWKQQMEETDFTPPVWANALISDILADVIFKLSIPSDVWEDSVTTLPYYGNAGTMKAWAIARELVEAERGRFFQDRQGFAAFWNRHALLKKTDVTATVSYTSGAYKPYDAGWSYGKHLSNKVRVVAHPRIEEAADELLWTLPGPIYVPAGEAVSLEAPLQTASGQKVATANLSQQNTSFSEGTASISVVPRGGLASITLTNNDGYAPAVLASMALWGKPLRDGDQVAVEREAASVAELGVIGYRQLDLKALSTYDEIYQIAHYELARRGEPTGLIDWLSYRRKADGVDNLHQLTWTIGDRLRISIPTIGPEEDYFIIGEEHRLGPGGLHETVYNLEPADVQRYWRMEISGFSELDQTTRLAY